MVDSDEISLWDLAYVMEYVSFSWFQGVLLIFYGKCGQIHGSIHMDPLRLMKGKKKNIWQNYNISPT